MEQNNDLLWSDLVECLERVDLTNSKETKRSLIEQLIESYKSTFPSQSLFSLMRLLVPRLDEKRSFGLKEAALGRLYVGLLALSPASFESSALLAWSNVKQKDSMPAEDFSVVVMNCVRSRSDAGCSVTTSPVDESKPGSSESQNTKLFLSNINDMLDRLCDLSNSSSQSDGSQDSVSLQRIQILRFFFQHCTPLEHKWIIRIILQNLRFGLSDITILALIHRDAIDFYNTNASLEQCCNAMANRTASDIDFESKISLFVPFQPMLSHKCLPTDIPKLIQEKPFWIEEKYDGSRLAMHMRVQSTTGRMEFRYYGRSIIEYSSHFGASENEKFSKRVAPLLRKDARTKSMILDGEMMVWDPKTRSFLPFVHNNVHHRFQKDNFTFLGSGEDTNEERACFVVFDLLYLNGNELTRVPLWQRYQWLQGVVSEEEATLMIAKHQEASTAQEVIDTLESVMRNRGEGLIVKDPKGLYLPGQRQKLWFKIKPDYISTMGRDFDLVIVGASKGNGRRANLFGAFVVAVRADDAQAGDNGEPDPTDTKWLTLCRVGTGFKDSDLMRLHQHIRQFGIPVTRNYRPAWLDENLSGAVKELPDYWIHPKDSLVLELKCTELNPSEFHGSQLSMRFPRCVRIRDDKPWWQAMTITELKQMYENNRGLGMHLVGNEDGRVATDSRNNTPKKKQFNFSSTQKLADLSKVSESSSIFSGLAFCVLTGCDGDSGGPSKQDLEVIVKENGGSVMGVPVESKTNIIVVGNQNLRTRTYTNTEKDYDWDVVKADWVIACNKEQRRIPLTQNYIIKACLKTRESLAKIMDRHGDMFEVDVSAEELEQLMSNMKMIHLPEDKIEAVMNEIDNRYSLYPLTPFSILKPYTIFIDPTDFLEIELAFLKAQVMAYGGKVEEELSPKTTHIILFNCDSSRLNHYQTSWNQTHEKKCFIVSREWLQACFCEQTVLDETPYLI